MIKLNDELAETYELREQIGEGGGGSVFRAWHKRLQKEVVLKKIHSKLTKNSAVNTRGEADILKNLKHEYLPQVMDYFELEGGIYTVMDFIPGQSFRKLLDSGERFSQDRVLKWFEQLCLAVEQLHKQEPPIIHGDIKPDNIMLTPEDNICLIDFNISGDFEEADIAGYTKGYAAPEQVAAFEERKKRAFEKKHGAVSAYTASRGSDATETADATEIAGSADPDATEIAGSADPDATEIADGVDPDATETDGEPKGRAAGPGARTGTVRKSVIDVRADIYSIGATIYHFLTGCRPEAGNVKPLDSYKLGISDSLEYIIEKCMEPAPDKRFQTVGELYNAVKNVYTSSRAYKSLIRKQALVSVVITVCFIGFIVLGVMGYFRIGAERVNKYYKYVDMQKEARLSGDYESVNEYYELAVGLFPDKMDAYLEKAYSYYEQKRYGECIDFIGGLVIDETNAVSAGYIYYVYAECLYETGEYEASAKAFDKSIELSPDNSDAYRDLAIALAYCGRAEEAAERLDTAVKLGLARDGVYYAQGEIAYSQGDYDTALENFKSCIDTSSDSYMKMRAYLMCSTILRSGPQSEETVREDIQLLETAAGELPKENLNAIYEQLAQAYIDIADMTGDVSYDGEAIKITDIIISNGWATFNTYQNKALLYQKAGNYDEARDVLTTMLSIYGDRYAIYKRLAFLEAAYQTESDDRDYRKFAEYYKLTLRLYEEQTGNNQTDTEINALTDIYEQAVTGGWIEEE